MKTFWFVLTSLLLLSPAFGQSEPSARLNVVATNSLVADWVKQVAGERVNLTTLVGPNADVHTFEPSPSDNIAIAKADITFEIGLSFEYWMSKLFAASGSKAKRIVLTNLVVREPLKLEHGRREDIDPHVWHNVRYVMGMVKRMAAVLESSDPDHAQMYKTNAQTYLKELEELDSWMMQQAAQIPRVQRQLVTNHDSLGYFCERYQFRLVGAAFDSATTEAEDPSAKDMAELIFKIKTSGVRGIFAENMTNSKFIALLAKEANVQLAPALYTDALGAPGSPGDTYVHMMRYNVQTIIMSLRGTQ